MSPFKRSSDKWSRAIDLMLKGPYRGKTGDPFTDRLFKKRHSRWQRSMRVCLNNSKGTHNIWSRLATFYREYGRYPVEHQELTSDEYGHGAYSDERLAKLSLKNGKS